MPVLIQVAGRDYVWHWMEQTAYLGSRAPVALCGRRDGWSIADPTRRRTPCPCCEATAEAWRRVESR